MLITKKFKLRKSQFEIDFVDINTDHDTPLFLDPFFLGIREDQWARDSVSIIQSFFQQVINLIQTNNISEARSLFAHLNEPNDTCLGMSKGEPDGRGVGVVNSKDIFDAILNSGAIQSGLIHDIEDNILFVDDFGKDKLSDMTTNLIRGQLILYTQEQCELHNIPLTKNVPSGYYWSQESLSWINHLTDCLIINKKRIVLVPKGIVSFSKSYTPERYYQHYVLNFLQNEHLTMRTTLVQNRVDGTPYVTKKSIKETISGDKEFLRNFTLRNPKVLAAFKARTKVHPLSNEDLYGDIRFKDFCKILGEQLMAIPSGPKTATDFHNSIIGILELIFYPLLMYPKKESEIHDGRKRIDIRFTNTASSGIFHRLHSVMKIASIYIYIECKNYSDDPANPELDQLAGRFGVNRGQAGFLICRTISNSQLFLQRCKDLYRDNKELIIPLTDQDILTLLDNHDPRNHTFLDQFLSTIIAEIQS